MSKAHLNILVQLAKVDGIVVQEEVDLINEVGKANGMTEEEIASCFDEELPIGDLSSLVDDEKYDLIYSIVQLMKIDGKLYNEEIKFCAKMSAKLGYEEDVLFELMLKIYADPDLCADKDSLKKHIQEYLIP
ncbi:MAG: TerB family tellurite resistance protein [Reichenbachiella sp.]|uniref:TerB family tellurite resistance protein n=1 Tax=Reichenbachiella sp. TaxID=2184521 RepID=UPI003267E211